MIELTWTLICLALQRLLGIDTHDWHCFGYEPPKPMPPQPPPKMTIIRPNGDVIAYPW